MQDSQPVDKWFLIRGLSRESGHWEPLLEVWEKHLPLAIPILLDLPGTGVHFKESSPNSLEEITDWVRPYFQAEAHEGRNFFLGLSLGGMIGLDWMTRYPNDFEGGVFINTSVANLSATHQRFKLSGIPKALQVAASPRIESKERAILELVSNDENVQKTLLQSWVQIQTERPVSLSNTLNQIAAARDFKCDFKKIKVPVLLLNSYQDRLVDASCSEKIQDKTGWELHTHLSAGHDISIDDPHWVLQRILDWQQVHFVGDLSNQDLNS